MSTQLVIEDITNERYRQIEVEGFDRNRDDAYASGELVRAAVAYALNAVRRSPVGGPRPHWPWDLSWWKPKSPREDLVRAAALIVAEIERIDRDAERKREVEEGPKVPAEAMIRIKEILDNCHHEPDENHIARIYALALGHHETWRPS